MRSLFIDIVGVCDKLGIDLEPAGYRLVGSCPFHSETRPSFNVYLDSNSFYCFSCQQGGNSFRLASQLVEDITSWRDLVRWYSTELPVYQTPVRSSTSLADIRNMLNTPQISLPDADLSTDPFLASLGISYITNGNLAGRHIFPIYLHNKLVAFEARDFTGRLIPKTLALPRDVSIHSYLWNFDNVVSGLPIVIVEGTKGALAVLKHGYINTVSSFGARLTFNQVILLTSKSPSEVIIAYDADTAGIEGADKAVVRLLAQTEVSVMKLPKGTDPWDVSRAVWEQCFIDREQILIPDRNKKLLMDIKDKFFS